MTHSTSEYRVCSLDTQPLHILSSAVIRLVQSPDTSRQTSLHSKSQNMHPRRSCIDLQPPPALLPSSKSTAPTPTALDPRGSPPTPRSQHFQRINARRRPTKSHQLTPHPLKTSIYAPRTSRQTAAAFKEGPMPAPCRFVPDRHACLQNILTMPPISVVDRLDF
jgi:hypothetical protein